MEHDPIPPGTDDLSRRTFVQAGAATLLTAASWRRVPGANERIGVGFIGYGLIGKRHLLDFQEQKDADLVAVAEVHKGRRDEGIAQIDATRPDTTISRSRQVRQPHQGDSRFYRTIRKPHLDSRLFAAAAKSSQQR